MKKITIDIYTDTICPWCYIGLSKLKSAMLDFSSCKYELTWRPFQLNPDMPSMGMYRQKYLDIKFNGKETAKKTYKNIYQEGIKNNIYFQFDKILITPNSFISHKLLALAHKLKKQTEIIETLFYEYFIEGTDIGNIKELIRISKQHDIYTNDTLRYLESSKDSEKLLAEETHARELGIKGVPCFIINKELVLYGAQDKINFINIFKSTFNER